MISLLNGHVNHILLNLKYSIYFHGITCDMNFLSHFQSVINRNINTKYEARIFSHLRCPTNFGISKPYKGSTEIKYFSCNDIHDCIKIDENMHCFIDKVRILRILSYLISYFKQKFCLFLAQTRSSRNL